MAQRSRGFSLVVHDGETGKRDVWHMLVAPESISHDEDHLVSVAPLPGADVVYMDSHGHDVHDVTWSGTFGLKRRRYKGEAELSGTELFFLFKKKCWDRVIDLMSSDDPKVKQRTRVEYHDWAADKHYYCVPESFKMPRDRSNRAHFRYDITFKLLHKIKQKFDAPKRPKAKQLARQVATYLNSTMGVMADARERMTGLSDTGRRYLQDKVFRPIERLRVALLDFASGVTDVVQVPGDDLRDAMTAATRWVDTGIDLSDEYAILMLNQMRQVRRLGNRLWSSGEMFKTNMDHVSREYERFFAPEVQPGDSDAKAAEVQGGYSAILRGYARDAAAPTYKGTKTVRVTDKDTLQTLATRHLGSATRWRDIALLNGLVNNSRLTPGTDILIPTIPASTGSTIAGGLSNDSYTTQQQEEERLYGVDLQLVEREDGKMDIAFGASNDLDLIGGRPNLRQAITLKVKTRQGQLLENPEYGLRDVLGKRHSIEDSLLLQHGLLVAAESDPRIEEASVELRTSQNATDVAFSLTPVGTTGRRSVDAVVKRI